MNQIHNNHKILIILLGLSLVLVFTFPSITHAQAQVMDQGWSDPVNISNSGGANDPIFVVDADGISHVLWRDTFIGNVTTSNQSGEWSSPEAGDFPFENNYPPTLVADQAGFIHAFWLNSFNELLYSKIEASNFGIVNSWFQSSTLAGFVINYSVTIDDQGAIQVAYIRTVESQSQPAGVYYTRSITNGTSWGLPTLLYESPYLRTVSQDQANIQINTALQEDGTETTYVVWDNLPFRRIFMTKTTDDGQTWDLASEIDGPRNTSGLSAPFNLNLAAKGQDVVLVWLVGQKGVRCDHYSKYSNDGGQTWSVSQQVFSQLTSGGCPQDTRLIGFTDSYATLMTNTQGQVFLSAWDGSSWSDPQLQTRMGNFVDPNTKANVELECHNIVLQNNQIMVVGCDQAAGSDIWFIQRDLGDLATWFPPPSVWKVPSILATSAANFQSLQTVADENGRVHALWMQPDGIHYSFWSNNEWIQPTNVVKINIDKNDKLVATTSYDGLLYIVWTSSETGEILFSWANSSRSNDANEWTSPGVVPRPQGATHSPDITVDASGTIYVIYSIPINENRGVYLVSSSDRGESWSNPVILFDGVLNAWEMVDQSRLSLVGGDHLVATWAHTSLDKGPLELYFSGFMADSTDPKSSLIVSNSVFWNDLAGYGENTVHRVWKDWDLEQIRLMHTYSTDKGVTWEEPINISGIGEVPGSSSITLDRSGQLHLTYFYLRDGSYLGIKNQIWNGDDWSSDEGISLGEIGQRQSGDISSVISSDDEIFTLYSLFDGNGEYALMFTQRQIDVPDKILDTVESSQDVDEVAAKEDDLSLTPTSTVEPTAEVREEQATPQNTGAAQVSAEQPKNTGNSFIGLVMGIGLAFILVAIAFLVRLLLSSRK